MIDSKKKLILLGFILVVIIATGVLIIGSINQSRNNPVYKQSAPPYNGPPVATFGGKGQEALFSSLSSDNYNYSRYAIGDFLSSQLVESPNKLHPLVEISKVYTELLNEITTTTFTFYSSDTKQEYQANIATDLSDLSQAKISINSGNYSKVLSSFAEQNSRQPTFYEQN